MRRVGVLMVLFVVVCLTAWADNPHFIRATAELVGADLLVSFKEAGLGDNQTIVYVASADATATYACFNGGDNHPQAANKETVSGPVSATGAFVSGKNGQITASLLVNALGPGDFSCPPGQTMVLADVSYSNIQVTDTTNGVTTSTVPVALSATFVELN